MAILEVDEEYDASKSNDKSNKSKGDHIINSNESSLQKKKLAK